MGAIDQKHLSSVFDSVYGGFSTVCPCCGEELRYDYCEASGFNERAGYRMAFGTRDITEYDVTCPYCKAEIHEFTEVNVTISGVRTTTAIDKNGRMRKSVERIGE